MSDKFLFNGDVYKKTSDGKENKLLDSTDIVAGDDIDVSTNEDGKLEVSSNLGITVVNGEICVIYEEEE